MNRLRRRAMLSVFILCLMWAVTATCLAVRRERVAASSAQSRSVFAEAGDPVSDFRQRRQQLRSRQYAQLNDIIYSQESSAENVSRAQNRLMTVMEEEAAETRLEGLLQSRGYQDALVSISGQSASVLIRGDALNQRKSAAILEAVMRETGITGGNVKIIPIK